jgi:hypothetical protein
VASLSIEDRLLHYFLAMGAQQSTSAPSTQNNLTLVSGTDTIHVMILTRDALAQRNAIIETLLDLASMRGTANQLFLAAPKVLGATIDAAVFRSYGIGLLLFDDRHIEETVPPQTIFARPQTPVASTPDSMVLRELSNLKSMYQDMELTITKMRGELEHYKDELGRNHSTLEPTPSPVVMPNRPTLDGPSGHLPSFFENNPWLDVLSRRGRSEGESIAA